MLNSIISIRARTVEVVSWSVFEFHNNCLSLGSISLVITAALYEHQGVYIPIWLSDGSI